MSDGQYSGFRCWRKLSRKGRLTCGGGSVFVIGDWSATKIVAFLEESGSLAPESIGLALLPFST